MAKTALPLLFAALLCLTGCRSSMLDITKSVAQQTINAASSQSSPPSDVSFDRITSVDIPYDVSDGLSPYLASSTINRYICGLLYDPLVRLRPDYGYEKVMAKQISSDDFVVWTITIPGNIKFPDGEKCNAYDVRYSFFRAMTEGSYYAQSLSDIGNVAVKDGYTVEVTLLDANRYFANLLTFPIIEYGSVEKPVGTGRYTLSEDGRTLTCGTPGAAIDTINLVDVEDHSLFLQETRIGVFDCVFIDDPPSVSMSSIGGTDSVALNNLVYLGMNSHLSFTNSTKFRRAVEFAIDREALAENAYSCWAAPAPSVFNPAFHELGPELSRTADPQAANALLDELGYGSRDKDGYRIYGYYGQRITLDLAVNSEAAARVSAARCIKDMLQQIGLDVNIIEYPYQTYLAAIENGATELYIAETKIDADMDISHLVSPDGTATFGFALNEDLTDAWYALRSGGMSFPEFDDIFYSAVPFVPLVYRYGSFIYSRSFYFDMEPTESDIFYNILEWK